MNVKGDDRKVDQRKTPPNDDRRNQKVVVAAPRSVEANNCEHLQRPSDLYLS